MRTKAAVVYAPNQPVVFEEIDLKPPERGEAILRVANAGVCHSDLHIVRGRAPMPMPLVIGHEGAAIVEEVGQGVKGVKPGDHVVLLWRTPCNHCYYCAVGRPALCDEAAVAGASGTMSDGTRRFYKGDQPLNHHASTSCVSQYTVMHENALIPIPADVPMAVAALMGCAVMTGVGAVVNTAQVRPGSAVAVFGAGGVGLSAIMGARLADAGRIIAIDVKQNKLDWALSMGATDAVNATETNPVEAIRELTDGRGVEYAFEAIGLTPVMEQAFDATRRGGTTVIIGAAPPDARMALPVRVLFSQERVVRGSWYGSIRPWTDIPWLVGLYQRGLLPIDRLITRHYPMEEYNEALRALEAGEVARSVLDIGST